MSPRGWQDRIRDILSAIAEIQKFTAGMDFESFKEDDKSIRAVEMNFIIIGEAANQIPEEVEEAHTSIPWSLMRAMRNRIVHDNAEETITFEDVHSRFGMLLYLLYVLAQATETLGVACWDDTFFLYDFEEKLQPASP